jgi:hypothetical protein
MIQPKGPFRTVRVVGKIKTAYRKKKKKKEKLDVYYNGDDSLVAQYKREKSEKKEARRLETKKTLEKNVDLNLNKILIKIITINSQTNNICSNMRSRYKYYSRFVLLER